MRIVLAAIVAVAAFGLGISSVMAHSFTSVFIVPVSGVDAEMGKQALDGFKLATRERDGHPDETADGHLGGRDVYVEVVDSAGGVEIMLARVRQLVERESAEVVSGVVRSDLLEKIRRQAEGTLTILIAPNGGPPSHIRTMDDRPFAGAFEEAYGYTPSRYAFAGYSVARIIDQAVRRVDGDFSNQEVRDIGFSNR